MPDRPFFPQLALFIASRSLLALYQEFIFPSVPRRTGLLPVTLDDIRPAKSENSRIALEIAISRAAVVIYDSKRGTGLSVDYVREQRHGGPLILVDAPPSSPVEPSPMDPSSPNQTSVTTEPEGRLERPREMSGWPETFVHPLLVSISMAVPPPPGPVEIADHLTHLEDADSYEDLVFTGLALLERQMRTEDLPTTLRIDPAATVMSRLREHFGSDYETVIESVALRHDLLQGVVVDREGLQERALALSDVVRTQHHAPPREPRLGS